MSQLDAVLRAPVPVLSVSPVALATPERGDDLQVRVTAPVSGHELPIVVFSHGMTLTMDDYAPLAGYWAARGFVVVQATHLDSLVTPADPRFGRIWRIRTDDLTGILDRLDAIEAAVPGLAGRLGRDRVAVAGHSWGAQTASTLAGATVLDADGVPGESVIDSRVRAAVLLCLSGTGGDDLSPLGAENFPFMNPGFAGMKTPSMIVAGDQDQSPLTVRGPDWFTDGYRLAPGATDLLTLAGGEHGLGGIQGAHDTRTTDEDPGRVALVQRSTTAYLRTALGIDDEAWPEARAALAADPAATVESR